MEALKAVLDLFGNIVFVPVMLFFVALILKTPVKKALISALTCGVGLVGFNFVTGGYSPYLTAVMNTFAADTGFALEAMDLGWQYTAAIAYSTTVGVLFIGIGLAFQFLIFFVGWTPVFMPTDLWNNYSYIIWGTFTYQLTHSMLLAFWCMILQVLYVSLFAEVTQKRWETYYGYPGTVMIAAHHISNVPLFMALDWVWNKIGLDKINFRPDAIQKKLGFLGDPMAIGFIVGMLVGLVGKFKHLGELEAWATIVKFAVATAATMAIFPKVGSIFAGAFTALTDASKKIVKKSGKTREVYIAVNDALGYGESATLTTGLLSIPIYLVEAFFLPGNIVLPIMSLTSLAYRCEVPIMLGDGNILKAMLSHAIYAAISLYICTYNADLFTEMATGVGMTWEGASKVCGGIAAMPGMFAIYWAFSKGNYLICVLETVLYFVLAILYKKNKPAVNDYLERQATSYKSKLEEAKA